MLKQKIIKSLAKFTYPQVVFASAILSYLRSADVKPKHIVDCPCGNGETTFHLAKIRGSRILAADRSEKCIEQARLIFQRPNIEFVCADIKSIVQKTEKIDVFCIINSLFLFPEAREILHMLKQKLETTKGKLILVIPNTEGKNLLWFQQHHPGETKIEIPYSDIKPFFEQFGFSTEFIKPIGFTHHFNRRDVRFLSVLRPFYLRLLNFFQKLLGIGKPNYFLVVLAP